MGVQVASEVFPKARPDSTDLKKHFLYDEISSSQHIPLMLTDFNYILINRLLDLSSSLIANITLRRGGICNLAQTLQNNLKTHEAKP